MKLRKLADQVIVITGASSGIGLATARMAAERGAKVVLASRDEVDLRAATDDIRANGGEAVYAVCDVADMESVRRVAVTAVREYGRIDSWFNNAGVSVYGHTLDVPLADARRLFETNYWGVVHGSLVAVEHLRDDGGALINMGSVASDRAIPLQGHYSASKHAIRGFTDSLRMELEKEGFPISVTLIKPGAIDTPYPHHARSYLEREPKNPPPVYAPEPVARAVLHCAEHPKRDIMIGGAARMTTAMGNVSPRLADRYMEATMFDGQQRSDGNGAWRTGNGHRQDTLYHPVPGDASAHGDQPGYIMRTSAYTQARLHPVAALLGSAAAVIAVTAAGRMLTRR